MADGGEVRRRREAPERFAYRQEWDRLVNFVDDELGQARAPRLRPDDSEWKIQRAKTIIALNGLREKLDTVCVGANYGKAAGNVAEIIGVLGAIIGSFMSLAGYSSGHKVMNTGNLVHHTGTLIDGASNVVESLVSAKYLREIEAELAKDKALSQPLAEWLDYSINLDTNVQRIFGVSLASKKWFTVLSVFYEFSKVFSFTKSFDATLSLMRQGKYSVYIGDDVKVEKLQIFFQHLSTFPFEAERIRNTLSVLSVSFEVFRVYGDGVKLCRSITGKSSSAIISTLQGGLEIPTAKAVSAYCFFQAISLAASVLSLIKTKGIIENGKSKYSDSLKELTKNLAWELREMEKR